MTRASVALADEPATSLLSQCIGILCHLSDLSKRSVINAVAQLIVHPLLRITSYPPKQGTPSRLCEFIVTPMRATVMVL
jgi:hypothetical protein